MRRQGKGLMLAAWLVGIGGVFAAPARAQEQAGPEDQLRQRVEGVYRLFVSGGWREVESYLTEDSKEIWLAQPKGRIEAFQIESLKIAPDGKKADVTVTTTFRIPRIPNAPFHQPEKSEWVLESGQWFLKLKPLPSLADMFQSGSVPSNPTPARPPLVFDQNPIQLPLAEPGAETKVRVSFQNVTADRVTIRELGTTCPCLKAEVDKTELQSGEQGWLTLTYQSPSGEAPLRPPMVQATLLTPGVFLLDLPVILAAEPTSP